MASVLFRLGSFSARRWKVVIVGWVLLLAIVLGGGFAMRGVFAGGFTLPPTEASHVLDEVDERFPDAQLSAGAATGIVRAPAGKSVTDPAATTQIEHLVSRLGEVQGVRVVASPFQTQAISTDSRYALIQVQFDTESQDVTDAQKSALQAAATSARDAGLTVEFGGAIYQGIPTLGLNETGGLVVALIVLVIALGGLISALIPIASAITGVGIGLGGVLAASGAIPLSQLTPLLPLMLGLAVGIDYALFIIARYQNELADGHDRITAAGRAVGTAGSAVVFAGLTVVIALAALSMTGLNLLIAMGVSSAATVTISILIALTLTPALLAAAGRRVKPRPAHHLAPPRADHTAVSVEGAATASTHRRVQPADAWIRLITRAPAVTVAVTLVVLATLALPAFQMRLNFPDNSMAAPDTTQYKANQLITDGFGPGHNGPLLVLVTGDDAAAGAGRVAAEIASVSDVEHVTAAVPNEAGDAAYFQIIPAGGPLAESTAALVATLRDRAVDWADEAGVDTVQVTGQAAIDLDSAAVFGQSLIPDMAVVVGLALILLLILFRSVLVPLKAALGFLLSLGATFGIVVAVFQWGWGGSLIGLHQPGPIASLLPLALTGVLFGLAMDYEVFIVSRMREEHATHGHPRRAVRVGFQSGARVVVAAAIIMISVFAGFIIIEDTLVKSIAFALAVGVFIDAFLIRMTLVPAIMTLLGKNAWWIPRWLQRLLPRIDVEGEHLTAHGPGAATPTSTPTPQTVE